MADWEWVNARHACNVADVFLRLQQGVQRDLDLRDAQREPKADYGFRVAQAGEWAFSAVLDRNKDSRRVDFLFDGREIRIRADGQEFVATVTLNDEKQCRLVLNGEQLEEWQLRKRMLEKLLFETA